MRIFGAKPVLMTLPIMAALAAGCGSTYRAAPVEDRTQARAAASAARQAQPAPKAVASNTPQPSAASSSGSTREQPPAAEVKPARNSTQAAPTPTALPPAVEPGGEGDWRPEYYTVRKGDTLYSIALDFGQDYRDIAAWNNLADAAYIQIGQRLRVSAPEGATAASEAPALPPATLPRSDKVAETPKDVPTFTDPMGYRSAYSQQAFNELQRRLTGEVETTVIGADTAPEQPKAAAAPAPPAATPAPQKPATSAAAKVTTPDGRLHWEWPASGDLLYSFSKGQKGIAIRGQSGQSVVSSAPGKVVYSGSGLRGYGNLIIVKHNATYLSVYAHNRQLLVSEGQMVAQGQKIGVMGEISPGETALHFEIRRLGKPIDPLELLPDRAS